MCAASQLASPTPTARKHPTVIANDLRKERVARATSSPTVCASAQPTRGSSPLPQLVKPHLFPPPHTHPNTLPLEPRRAAVALIIRVVPPPNFPLPPKPTAPPSLTQFFDFDWVKHPSACPKILFVRRQKPENADIN
jgi:hypothetical protein